MAKRTTRTSKSPANADAATPSGELSGSAKMGVAVISGATFQNKSVVYYEVDGHAMVEGDINLGSADTIQKAMDSARGAGVSDEIIAFGVGITGSQFRWPNCQIPYEIDPSLPNQQRVADAIAHWESRTPFRFPLRTPANAAQHPDYVQFFDGGGCWSRLGKQGGKQQISLGSGCTAGNAIHEIGHTVGLWHEQSREDRDLFVTIHWENIQSGMAAQFNQHITDGDDLGAYDYGSIMHYPRTAFSKNNQETITPTNAAAQIGQRTALSAGDIAAVRAMYPGCAWPVVIPKKLRDDGGGFKKMRDDPRPKKTLDDTRFKKILDDRPPVKRIGDPIGGPGGPIKRDTIPAPGLPGLRPTSRPGALAPFSMATPHHAGDLAGDGCAACDAGTMTYLTALQRQLLESEAAVAEARARAAQAAVDVAHWQEASDAISGALADAMDESGGGG
jgi:Astacin (Peptidase family M12A)